MQIWRSSIEIIEITLFIPLLQNLDHYKSWPTVKSFQGCKAAFSNLSNASFASKTRKRSRQPVSQTLLNEKAAHILCNSNLEKEVRVH